MSEIKLETKINELIEKLSKAVSFQYPGKFAPSLLISWLPNRTWYVSVLQYLDSHEEKSVLHKARNTDLFLALKEISNQLLNSVIKEKDPLDELNEIVRE